ncbi:MAG: hypothetical protein Q7S53_05300 [bacterium]|nr:hypothetical protein [bacterium]
MKEIEENNPEASNEELSNLKDALRQAIDDGDMKRAGDLKAQIMPHLSVLRGELSSRFDEAKEIMGDDFLGPEAIKETFGIKVETKDVPEIPFSKKELERAKELEQFLVLRVDKSGLEDPLTIGKMADIVGFDIDSEEDLLMEDTIDENAPETGWALVTTRLVPLSKNRDYFEQVGALAQYLHAQVFKGEAVPKVYQEALSEYVKEQVSILREISAMKTEALESVTDLEITKLLMPTASEAVYDMLMYCANSNGKLNMFGMPGDTHGVVTRDTVYQGTGSVEVAVDSGTIILRYDTVHRTPDTATGTLFARRF